MAFNEIEIQRLHFFARPWRAAQKFQAGLDARVTLEAVDIDLRRQCGPAKTIDQRRQQRFQRDTVQGIFRRSRFLGSGVSHWLARKSFLPGAQSSTFSMPAQRTLIFPQKVSPIDFMVREGSQHRCGLKDDEYQERAMN